MTSSGGRTNNRTDQEDKDKTEQLFVFVFSNFSEGADTELRIEASLFIKPAEFLSSTKKQGSEMLQIWQWRPLEDWGSEGHAEQQQQTKTQKQAQQRPIILTLPPFHGLR